MFKSLLLALVFTLLMEAYAETTENQTEVNNTTSSPRIPVQRPLHFVVVS
jgi:hypothetical protein